MRGALVSFFAALALAAAAVVEAPADARTGAAAGYVTGTAAASAGGFDLPEAPKPPEFLVDARAALGGLHTIRIAPAPISRHVAEPPKHTRRESYARFGGGPSLQPRVTPLLI